MLKNKIADEKIPTLLSSSQLTIIDLAHMGTEECPVKSVVVRVAEQLKKALSERGLAVLVNHGIPEDKLKMAWNYLDNFCDLPTEIKEVYLRKSGMINGYVKPNEEKFNGTSSDELRHAFNICTLSGASLPEEPLFKDHIADLAKDFKNLSSLLLQALAVAMELPLNFFLAKHAHMLSDTNDENDTTLRLLYYPALVEDDNKCEMARRDLSYSYQKCASHMLHLDKIVDDEDEEEEVVIDELKKHRGLTKCGANCDYGTFTLLAQDSENGLECKLPPPHPQRWQKVGHLPGSILINTGELLSLWTNEKFPALPHRVIVPEQALTRSKGRHAMAFFVHPDNDTEIVPIECQSQIIATNGETKKKKSFHTKMLSAYQHIQNKFKQSNPS